MASGSPFRQGVVETTADRQAAWDARRGSLPFKYEVAPSHETRVAKPGVERVYPLAKREPARTRYPSANWGAADGPAGGRQSARDGGGTWPLVVWAAVSGYPTGPAPPRRAEAAPTNRSTQGGKMCRRVGSSELSHRERNSHAFRVRGGQPINPPFVRSHCVTRMDTNFSGGRRVPRLSGYCERARLSSPGVFRSISAVPRRHLPMSTSGVCIFATIFGAELPLVWHAGKAAR